MLKFFILLLFLLGSSGLSHNPRVEDDDWGDFDTPYLIEDGTVSFAMFGYLDESDIDVFQLEFAEADDTLRLNLLIPVCDDIYAEFYPSVLIAGPADEGDLVSGYLQTLTEYEIMWGQLSLWAVTIGTTMTEATPPEIVDENLNLLPRDTSESLPEGNLAIKDIFTTFTQDERPVYYEIHTQRDYYETESIDITVTQAGSYYLVVYDLSEKSGDYLLSFGYKERFFRPSETEPENVKTTYQGVWPHVEGC